MVMFQLTAGDVNKNHRDRNAEWRTNLGYIPALHRAHVAIQRCKKAMVRRNVVQWLDSQLRKRDAGFNNYASDAIRQLETSNTVYRVGFNYDCVRIV